MMSTQSPLRSGCAARIWPIVRGVGFIFALLLTTGYLYQLQTNASDFEQYPPPGKRVDVGRYSLHIRCTGQGSPSVVVEGGNGDFSLGWQGIQPEVVKFTRICTYDRARYGWSDASPKQRSTKLMAYELHTLLDNAGEAPPFVLVGHSLGGFYARMFATLYRDEAAGIVLVDAAHEKQYERLLQEYVSLDQQQRTSLRLMSILARFGILSLLGNASQGRDFAPPTVLKMPDEIQPAFPAMMSHPSYFDTTLGELRALPENDREMQSIGGLGDTPLIVLTAAQSIDAATLEAMGYSSSINLGGIQQTWLDLQEELAALSTDSEHIVVEDSSHTIQLDKPDIVIEAIHKMVETTK